MSGIVSLAQTQLFEGLEPDELHAIGLRMRPRRFAAGERFCTAGEDPDRLWVITGGLVRLWATSSESGGELELRCHRGDVIGHLDAFSGGPRTASAAASTIVSALELDAADLFELAKRFPQILVNVIHTQRDRLLKVGTRGAALSAGGRSASSRGEEVAVIAGPSLRGAVGSILAAACSASAQPVRVIDRSLSFAGALTAADAVAGGSEVVLIAADLDPETLGPLMDQVDRVVAVAGNADEADRIGRIADAAEGRQLDIVLASDEAQSASRAWRIATERLIVRRCPRQPGFPLADADVAWLARHLTRTKLGLALGAGGAKGFAHVGTLQVLEEAGYVVDYVGGSSIGGFVAAQVALGYDAATIDSRFRAAFDAEALGKLFSSPFGGGSAGVEALGGLLRQATNERFFSHAVIPLVIMAVDLTDRRPVQHRSGPLWEALLGALAVAGVFPPRDRDGHRLVDAIALVPVPTAAVLEDGADVVVSVNLLGAEALAHWPDRPEPEPEQTAPARPRRRGPLDTMLEVMDLSQVDTSARHAALADVVVTPRFGPADWRDFQLADLFLAAGREAAITELPALHALSRPVDFEEVRRRAPLRV